MIDGSLNKVEIKAFTDKKFKKNKANFKLPLNPETYSRNHKVNYDTTKGQGNEGTDPKYKSTEPEEVKLDFIFDGTETIEGYLLNGMSVSDQVDEFLETTYKMEGPIHKPNYLQISWGKLQFKCTLKNLDVNYTLFDSDGQPLRAKLSATFLEYKEQESRVRQENKQSPDLTHFIKISQEETLPLMVNDIYGDDRYYLQVAKANNLTSFRNIKSGEGLIFPPLDKNSQ